MTNDIEVFIPRGFNAIDSTSAKIQSDHIPIPSDQQFTKYGIDIDEFLKKGGKIVERGSVCGSSRDSR